MAEAVLEDGDRPLRMLSISSLRDLVKAPETSASVVADVLVLAGGGARESNTPLVDGGVGGVWSVGPGPCPEGGVL